MINNQQAGKSTDPQPSPVRAPKAGDGDVSLLNPNDPIEVGTGGNGTTTDPAATDKRPPGYGDLDYMA